MNYVTAIVLAAGRGLRFSRPANFTVKGGIPTRISKMIKSGKSKISKPLAKINSKPVIIYSLDTLNRHPLVKDIIVVVNTKNSRSITSKIRQYRIGKISRIVEGGARRQDSVLNGLKAVDKRADLVLIHDVVRPFIEKNTISAVIKAAKKSGAAIVGVPVKATIKEVTRSVRKPPRRGQGQCASLPEGDKVTGKVKKTLDRNNLWEVQTPQVFRKDLILKAFDKFANLDVTDDASLVEKLGVKVNVVLGSYENIKITTPEDLIIAETILNNKFRCKKA